MSPWSPVVVLLIGCGSKIVRRPVPVELWVLARILGILNARSFGGQSEDTVLKESPHQSFLRERALAKSGEVPLAPTADSLAISGGGDHGAFGAGLLAGWTEAGGGPQFKLVTGINTGSRISPLAFLDPERDPQLKGACTKVAARDILKTRGIPSIFRTEAMADTDPLAGLIARFFTDETLRKIAVEPAGGGWLFVGTTSLDAQRSTIWGMGAIASSGHPDALTLFRKTVMASASIPLMFPPQYCTTEANGSTYDEMHEDGGTTCEVFLSGFDLNPEVAEAEVGIAGPDRPVPGFVIRNAVLTPEVQTVTRRIRPIGGEAISMLTKYRGRSDLYRMYWVAEGEYLAHHQAFVLDSCTRIAHVPFHTAILNSLYECNSEQARSGYVRQTAPVFHREQSATHSGEANITEDS